jgi:hypothetical protein
MRILRKNKNYSVIVHRTCSLFDWQKVLEIFTPRILSVTCSFLDRKYIYFQEFEMHTFVTLAAQKRDTPLVPGTEKRTEFA